MESLPRRRGSTALAVSFTLAFTALHVYWAPGGTWGLPPAALQIQEATRTANVVVSAIMLGGAGWILALRTRPARRVPSWLLLAPLWLAAVVCLSHAAFGFVTKGLYVAGYPEAVDFPRIPRVDPVTAAAQNYTSAVLDLVVFEPCFLAQGLVLALVGHEHLRQRRHRRAWVRSLLAASLVVAVFGAVLTLTGQRVAIG